MEPSSACPPSPPPPTLSSYEIATAQKLRTVSEPNRLPRTLKITPTPPITVLEDLATVHHLLAQDPNEALLVAEQAAVETFCSLMWGHMTWQSYISATRSFGRPALRVMDLAELNKMPHGCNCIYRNKGLELLSEVIERAKSIDLELGCILESCKGDWMVRFRRHGWV